MIMAKILIVEDEIKLRQELEVFLNNNGYQTEVISDFSDTLDQMLHFNGDLILLDINLPNSSGQFLCKEYRKSASTPIIIVTSRNNEMDELMIEDTSKLYETNEIKVYDKTKDKYFTALTSLSNEDVDILMAGGALNYIKDQQ